VLNWSLSGTSEKPSGGYDIVIDGVDTNATWRTTGTSRTISGLNAKVAHTFIVEARWYQASPAEFPRSKGLTVNPVEAYSAPVLNSAKLENGKYILNWSLPANPTGTPEGGYDIWIDGKDTNATWRATGTSQTISGLDTKVAHKFKLEARWNQANPSVFPQSNELTVEAFLDTTAPTVAITSPSANTTVTDAQTLNIVASASDDIGVTKVEFYKGGNLIGTDTTNTFSTTLSLKAADNGTFNITAVAYDAAGNTTTSSPVAVTVNIVHVEAYPAPVLDSAKLENGKYILNWSLPANPTGTPTGGYDIFIDGVDTNATWRATGTSQTISGLNTKVAHKFKLEARWNQANPSVFPQSKELTVEAFRDTTAPTVAITSPSANTTVTSAQTLNIVASASDDTGVTKVEFFDGGSLIGTDTTNPFSVSLPVTEGKNGTHNITAVAYDAAGNSAKSAAVTVTVNIVVVSDPYPAPVLQSVKAEGTNMVLSWTIPNSPNGLPSGGYDIWIDGKDTGTTWRTTQTSASISGLSAGLEHSFQVEARWLQANPYQYPLSNKLYGTISAENPSDTPPTDNGPLRAFPGAEGFGANSKGGRGGKVIKVTNLNGSGTGSLRAAIEASGPRIVVFEVSGQINFGSSLVNVKNPYITIAGQTAPSPGITIQGGIMITTHDVIFQHVRIRGGAGGPDDVLRLMGGSSPSSSIYNIIIDHCSLSWPGGDETFSTVYYVRDVTVSNSLVSETTNGASGAFLSGNYTYNLSILRNVLAHNNARNPRIDKDSTVAAINNISYNTSSSMFALGGTGSGTYVSMVGNKFIYGPSTPSGKYFISSYKSIEGTNKLYVDDNSYPSNDIDSGARKYLVGSPPVPYKNVTVRAVSTLESYLLPRVGARPADRDPVDSRIIKEVQQRKGSIITSESAVGGFPSLAKNTRSFVMPANPNGDDDGDGYTNIEEVLYQMAKQVEGGL
jgi:hypothetical protein